MTKTRERELYRIVKRAWGCVGDKTIYLPLPKYRYGTTMVAVEELRRNAGYTVIDKSK